MKVLPAAVVFDMDGVLIDSEPLWRRAEVEIFRQLGLRLEESDCEATMGQRIDAVVAYWHARQPWQGESLQSVAGRIVERVAGLIREQGHPLPGAVETVRALHRSGVLLGLASSSWMRLIDAVVDRLALRSCFRVLHSAEQEAHGKPAPDVYLTACRRLGVNPADAWAVEDACSGVQAARSAGMQVLAVPAPANRDNPCFHQAQACLERLDAAFFLSGDSGVNFRAG